ncbi:MAG TPA: FUSC family protein [Gaiellaceae bacterium]
MPSRKQRRRQLKEKRHEYEFVYVDSEGNELEELPEGFEEKQKERSTSRNGSKPAAKKQAPQRGGAGRRTPPVPSWNRALKRGALLGVVVFALFSFTAKGHWVSVLPLALLYTVLFVPFTYVIDRFAYRRWEARQSGGASRPPKKR